MTQVWTTVEFPGLQGLRQLEGDWRRLVAAMPDHAPRHLFETHLAYAESVPAEGGKTSYFALSDSERIRAICPLDRRSVSILGRPTRVWCLSWALLDFARDLICPPDEAERELLPALRRSLPAEPERLPLLVIDEVLEGFHAWRCLQHLGARSYCVEVLRATDVFDCDRSFEEVAAGFSKRSRDTTRKTQAKLAALADVRYVTARDPGSLAREFETFVAVEASGWKGRAGTALLQVPAQLALYRDLVARLGPSGQCEINALYAEGRCIASEFCLRAGHWLASLKIAYDERYRRLTPGRLLVEHTLERCCADPTIKRLNLVTHQGWHRSWQPRAVPVVAAYVALRGLRGRVLVGLLDLRFRLGPKAKPWLLRTRAGAALVRRLGGEPAQSHAGKED